MSLDISVKRKFTVNGKEYNSIEEMPEEVRNEFQKVMGMMAEQGHHATSMSQENKVVFNAMLGAGEPDTPSSSIPLRNPGSEKRKEPGFRGMVQLDRGSQPIKFEISLSPRALMVIVILGGLLFLLGYFLNGR